MDHLRRNPLNSGRHFNPQPVNPTDMFGGNVAIPLIRVVISIGSSSLVVNYHGGSQSP